MRKRREGAENLVSLAITIRPDQKERLEVEALRLERSVSYLIREVCDDYFARKNGQTEEAP